MYLGRCSSATCCYFVAFDEVRDVRGESRACFTVSLADGAARPRYPRRGNATEEREDNDARIERAIERSEITGYDRAF